MNPPGIPQIGIAYLRNQATALMRSQVHVSRPGVPVYDPVTGNAVGTTGTSGYVGAAHIHPAVGGAAVYQNDALVSMVQVQVSLPWNAIPVPHEEDQVVVISDDDASLVGKTLRVVDVSAGGIGFAVRMLTCTFVEPNPYDPLA